MLVIYAILEIEIGASLREEKRQDSCSPELRKCSKQLRESSSKMAGCDRVSAQRRLEAAVVRRSGGKLTGFRLTCVLRRN
jgi:hypothetical protein